MLPVRSYTGAPIGQRSREVKERSNSWDVLSGILRYSLRVFGFEPPKMRRHPFPRQFFAWTNKLVGLVGIDVLHELKEDIQMSFDVRV